jgi:hypothetical protein
MSQVSVVAVAVYVPDATLYTLADSVIIVVTGTVVAVTVPTARILLSVTAAGKGCRIELMPVFGLRV